MTEKHQKKIFTRITIDLKEDKDFSSMFTLLENFLTEHGYSCAFIGQRRFSKCSECSAEHLEYGSREPYDSADDENEAW